METIKRSSYNIGRQVKYTNLKSPHFGRITTITGFRGDFEKGIPNVTLSDGNSIPASGLAYTIPMPKKMKKCPFCKIQDLALISKPGEHSFIFCCCCEAQGPRAQPKTAIELWNHRPLKN